MSALVVSGYTAYMQRQQVRAAVWPILEFDTSNGPMIRFTVDNKGVGPAIIRHVVVTVDRQPVRNWKEVLDRLVGPGPHKFSESGLNGHVFSAGESVDILIPHDSDGNPLALEKSGSPLGTVKQGTLPGRGGDLLLLHAWRMLDSAQRRENQ